jgi:hypothetical protein
LILVIWLGLAGLGILLGTSLRIYWRRWILLHSVLADVCNQTTNTLDVGVD